VKTENSLTNWLTINFSRKTRHDWVSWFLSCWKFIGLSWDCGLYLWVTYCKLIQELPLISCDSAVWLWEWALFLALTGTRRHWLLSSSYQTHPHTCKFGRYYRYLTAHQVQFCNSYAICYNYFCKSVTQQLILKFFRCKHNTIIFFIIFFSYLWAYQLGLQC
jgi:hypothetical protein